MNDFVSRAFRGRRRVPEELADRLPPGQYNETGFPVLTAGPTPKVATEEWSFRIDGMVGKELEWSWEEFGALPVEEIPCDIHCVTKWSKLGTSFRGVSVDVLLEEAEPLEAYAMAYSYGGYTTNHAIEDLTDGKAWVVTEHEGEPLPREHGGPARLLVPHLYFWKSAKWLAGLRVMDHDEPGFWEQNGYHNHGDPWKEQRYTLAGGQGRRLDHGVRDRADGAGGDALRRLQTPTTWSTPRIAASHSSGLIASRNSLTGSPPPVLERHL